MNPYLMPRSVRSYAAILAQWQASGMGPEAYATALGQRCKRSTVALHLSVLRQHSRDAMERGEATSNPWASIKPPRREYSPADAVLVRSLSPTEAKVLYDYLLGPAPGPRDSAMLGLMLLAALRVSEVASLTWDRVGPEGLTVTGKGGKTRIVPILPQLANLLARIKGGEGKVIGLTVRGIQAATNRHLEILGLKKAGISCHGLRHSAATCMVIAGASIEAVRAFLGHSSIAVTQVYIDSASRYMANPALAFEKLMTKGLTLDSI